MIVFRAPDDCLQYYTGSSGEFKSFNFANGIQRSLTIIFPYQSYPIMKIWANLDLDFLQANCSPARPTESASDKSLVSNFFHKKHRLSPKDTKKIISWYFSDYCAISYRASLSPSDAFEMLTCEKQSSSFKPDRLMNLATTYLLNIIMTYLLSVLTILILSSANTLTKHGFLKTLP